MKQRAVLTLMLGSLVVAFAPGQLLAAGHQSTPITPSSSAASPEAERPTWTVGDKWRYDWTDDGKQDWAVNEYVGTVEKDGKTYHLIKTRFWRMYFDADLNIVADEHVNRGKVAEYNPAWPDFNWPLVVGKKWTGRFTHSGIASDGSRYSHTDEWAFKVLAYEKVKTPAGEFEAFRILARQTNNLETGDRVHEKEYWYAPAVKRILKYEIRGPRYSRTGEVTRFSLAEHEAK